MTFQFIRDHREHFPVRLMCRVLEASPSGFYDWLRRPESQRTAEDRALGEKIQGVHNESRRTQGRPPGPPRPALPNESRRTYGSPRVHASLALAVAEPQLPPRGRPRATGSAANGWPD